MTTLPTIRLDSEGHDNQNVGVNYGTLIKNLVLHIKQERPQALRQLPPDIPDFVGRRAELEQIEQTVQAQAVVAISAVAGMGGVGKSALVVHLAHRLVPQQPDAQLYVNLQGTDGQLARDPQDVIREWLRGFGLEDVQIATMSPKVQQDFYRSVLAALDGVLVLDNARDAAQVEPLLPGQGRCRVLITSREVLGLRGVQPLRLEVMQPAEALDLLVQVSGRSGLTVAQQGIAAGIVDLCGRLPLALRIAGAILSKRSHWGWEQLAQALATERQRLETFAHLHGVVKPGQDLDVRSSFNLSYGLLGAAEQRRFAQLSAVPGQDWGLGVAAAVTEDETVAETVERLVDLQLLEGLPGQRYRWHDLVRLFGQEQLADGEWRTLGLRAVQWYVAVMDYADDCLREQLGDARELAGRQDGETPLQTRQRLLERAYNWGEVEWENLKGCVQWASRAEAWEEACRLPRLMDLLRPCRDIGQICPRC